MIIESYEDLIILSGELRFNFWDTVHTAISLALKRSPQGVIIDCSQITECTIDGADTFRDVMSFIEDHEARVIVASVPAHVMEVLKQVQDVRSQLPVTKTVEEARASLYRLQEPEESKRKKKALHVGPTYLVGMSGGPNDDYALQIACEHAEKSSAKLFLMYPIIVPRELPLQTPMAEDEAAGEALLERARHYCENLGIHCERAMERGRDVASLIEESLKDHQATQIFIPLPDGEPEGAAKIVKSVLTKVQAPVLFIRDRKPS